MVEFKSLNTNWIPLSAALELYKEFIKADKYRLINKIAPENKELINRSWIVNVEAFKQAIHLQD